jgi:hypothetical protein
MHKRHHLASPATFIRMEVIAGKQLRRPAVDLLLRSALTMAGQARKEADSFEADIKSAKKQAEALQRAANAEAKLEQIKTPRSLTNTSALTVVLKEFKGTEYTVIGCFQDQESIDLLVQIDTALVNAGGKRVKSPPQNSVGDIQLTISKDFAVPLLRDQVYI